MLLKREKEIHELTCQLVHVTCEKCGNDVSRKDLETHSCEKLIQKSVFELRTKNSVNEKQILMV